jgi:hypothetical protein
MNSHWSSSHGACSLLWRGHSARESRRSAIAAGVLCLFTVGTAYAQEAGEEQARRTGFWLGFGAGSGWNITEAPNIDQRPRGTAAYLRVGGTLTQQVLLSGEFIGRAITQGDTTVARVNVTLSMMLFPSRTGGFFFKGGIGVSSVGTSSNDGPAPLSSNQGLALTAGAGFDWRVGGNLYVTPNVDWLWQSFPSSAGTNLWTTTRLLLVTVGLTWH